MSVTGNKTKPAEAQRCRPRSLGDARGERVRGRDGDGGTTLSGSPWVSEVLDKMV